MTQEEAFLREILERPEDDSVRLIFADWLEDHGDLDRAEFIRLMIRRESEAVRGSENWRDRAAWLLQSNWSRWVVPLVSLVYVPHLGLLNPWLTPRPQGSIAGVVTRFPRGFIQSLHLSTRSFVDHGEAIHRLAPITHLKLSEAGEVASRLAACRQLEWIRWLEFADYYRTPIYADAMFTLANTPHLKRLRALMLGRNHLGDRGASALAGAPWMRNVERLDLMDNGISLQGLADLVQSTQLGNLKFLILDRNYLQDGAATVLAQASWLPGLTHLSLQGTEFTDRGARLLRSVAPQLTVVFSGGSLSPRSADPG